MTPTDPNLRAIIEELANALQSVLLLSARLEPDLRQSSRDAGQLYEAVSRAARAIQELQPRRDMLQQ